MKAPYVARVDERRFLNLPGFHDGAYVVAYVEDTSNRAAPSGDKPRNFDPRLILEIADCVGRVNLQFDLYSAHQRANSFHKIDALLEALMSFRAGLVEEAALVRSRDSELRKRITSDSPKASGRRRQRFRDIDARRPE